MFRRHSITTSTAVSVSALLALIGILTFCFRSFQPEKASLCYPSPNGTKFAVSDKTAETLIRASNTYLRDTAQLLGSKYDKEFYRNIVRGGLESIFTGESISNPAKPASGVETFLTLFGTDEMENDPTLSEALAFLKKNEPAYSADLPPALIYCYDAGNPLNAAANGLIAVDREDEYVRSILTGPIRNADTFTLFFSFFSVIVPFFPQNSVLLPLNGFRLIRRFATKRFTRFLFQSDKFLYTALFCLIKVFTDPRISERKTVVLVR